MNADRVIWAPRLFDIQVTDYRLDTVRSNGVWDGTLAGHTSKSAPGS